MLKNASAASRSLAALLALGAAPPPALDPAGPPFPAEPASLHQVAAKLDTQPARGILSILGGGPQPGATLRSLKASATMARALAAEGLSPEDFYGRLVASAAGTPDPLLASYAARAPFWGSVLDALDAEVQGFDLEARRVLSLLPPEPPSRMKMTLVPFFAVSGFQEVAASSDGDEWTFVADLPRIAGESATTSSPREVTLKTLRATDAVAWRSLASQRLTGPAWSDSGADVDALLARTVIEGPPMIFLIPEEFFPLDTLFEEPIARALSRWSAAVEALADPKTKESERSQIVSRSLTGDFWGRSAVVTGAAMTDTLLRKAGRDAYLTALAAGPRAVVSLWLETTRGTKLPQPTRSARKELERRFRERAKAAKR